jgi:hypothetical protein
VFTRFFIVKNQKLKIAQSVIAMVRQVVIEPAEMLTNRAQRSNRSPARASSTQSIQKK